MSTYLEVDRLKRRKIFLTEDMSRMRNKITQFETEVIELDARIAALSSETTDDWKDERLEAARQRDDMLLRLSETLREISEYMMNK